MNTFSCFNDKVAVINQTGLNETIQNLYGSIKVTGHVLDVGVRIKKLEDL